MSRHARIELRVAHDGARMITDENGRIIGWEYPSPSKRPHYLRLVAANGQVLATSEVYANRSNARRAVKAWAEAFESVCRNYYGGASEMAVVEFDADGREVAR